MEEARPHEPSQCTPPRLVRPAVGGRRVGLAAVVGDGGVGLYRIPQVTQATFDMAIPGVVESGGAYAALVYVDANGNGTYDNPAMGGGDLGWSVAGVADDRGLSVTVDGQMTASATVDVGAP